MRKKILMKGLKFVVIAFLILLLPLVSAFAIDSTKIGGRVKSLKPKISSELVPLIEEQKAKAQRVLFPGLFSRFVVARTTVVLEFDENISPNTSRIARYGGHIKRRYKNFMAVDLPVNNLEAVARGIPGIKNIRKPHKPAPSHTSEGTGLTGASTFQTAGYKGKGVKVAIIDLGFIGLTAAKSHGDLPNSVITRDFTGTGLEAYSEHGTAVAEIVYDMAPDAQLYLIKIGNDVELGSAKDYCKAQGIKVINHSVCWFNTGPGDGTGAICDIVVDAKNNGILWVNSSGNYAERHWQGTFTTTVPSGTEVDPDTGDTYRVHEFVAGDESSQTSAISANAGEIIQVYMRWNDWPRTRKSYGLLLYDRDAIHDDTVDPVASAAYIQDGSQPPMVYLSYTVPATQTYYLAVISLNVSQVDNVQIEIFSPDYNLEYKTADNSLAEPSDSSNAMAVGAISKNSWTNGPIEYFSSQGPTNSWAGSAERIKPDVCGPDRVSTFTYDPIYGSFPGTSASSPHVAGAAALLLSVYPNMTVDQLRAELEAKAGDLGTSGKDNIYGAGKLNLPSPVAYLQNVVINEFVPNPDGSNPEWVELYNKGSQAVNIGGCWLLDSRLLTTDITKKIPDGTIIQPGGFYVHTLDTSDGYLNNDGSDTINFIAPNGTTVIESKSVINSSSYPDQSIYRYPDGDNWASGFDDSPTKSAANNGPTPRGSLKFTVNNKDIQPTADALIMLYDSSAVKVSEGTTASDGTYTFTNLSVGTYSYEIYYPSSNADVRRLWATGSALSVLGGQTTNETSTQRMPYITAISLKDSSGNPVNAIEAGQALTIDITVKNDDIQTRSVYSKIQIDKEKDSDFLYTAQAQAKDITQNNSQTYTLTYTPSTSITDNTILYLNVEAITVLTSDTRTDYSNWSKSFTVTNAPKGSLKITVNNKDNIAASGALLILYDSQGTKLSEATTISDGSYTFTNLAAGTYSYEAYYPANDASIRSYWASGSSPVSAGQTTEKTLTQQNPYIIGVTVKDNNGQPKTTFSNGDAVRVSVEVKNSEGVLRNVYPNLYLDGNKQVPYYDQFSKANEAKDIASGGTAIFDFDFTVPGDWEAGTVYINAEINSKYGTIYSRTDIGNWNWSFQVAAAPNQPPTIAGVPNQQGTEDIGWSLDLTPYINDAETAKSSLIITENSAYAAVSGQTITFNYPNGITTEQATITVSDGELSASQAITVDIIPVNDPPTLATLPDQSMAQGTTKDNVIDLWEFADDIDNSDNSLAFTIVNNVDPDCGITIDNNRYLDIAPAADYTGAVDVMIKVADPAGLEAQGQFKVTVVPSNLLSETASFIGEKAFAGSGYSVSLHGDINGDGFNDLIIGAPYFAESTYYRGKIYIIFGKSAGWTKDSILTNADASFISESSSNNELAGYSVASGGDLNADGYDDLIIGALGNDIRKGKVYVIFGKQVGWSNNVNLSQADASFVCSISGAELGRSVSFVGDVNGDGYDDFIVTSPGNKKAYLVFGKSSGWFDNVDIDTGCDASFSEENSTLEVSSACDINGDSYDDLLIASPFKTYNGLQSRGEIYVIFGKTSGWLKDLSLDLADASFVGMSQDDRAGRVVNSIGDINNDGYDDFGIGSPSLGILYIIFGKSDGWSLHANLDTASASFVTEASNLENYSLSGGDINGDGYSDLVLGVPYVSKYKQSAGQCYVALGKKGNWQKGVNISAVNHTFIGQASGDKLGQSICSFGDSDGDGYDDMLTGAPFYDFASLENIGKAYFIRAYNNTSPSSAASLKLKTDETYAADLSNYVNIGDRLYIQLEGQDADAAKADVAEVFVKSDSDTHGIKLRLIETAVNSGIFRANCKVVSTGSSQLSKRIRAKNSDIIRITFKQDATKYTTVGVGAPPNNPPAFDPITDKATDEGQELKFTANATDVDAGDILTYSVSSLPQGASFDPATHEFKWTPSDTQGRTTPYTVTFTVSDGKASASINVKITVNNTIQPPPNNPAIAISSPLNQAEVSGIITATAVVSGGTIDAAYLYVDNNSVSIDVSAPYSFSWNTTSSSNGSHILKVRASYSYYESDIKKTGWVESAVVNVTVNNPVLSVAITSPANNSTVSGTINIAATAVGASFVYYYIDGVWNGQSFSPFSYAWNTTTTYNGTHTIFVKAFYSATLQWVTSNAITVTVNNASPPNIPTVNITSPAEGSTVNGTATITAEVTNATASGVYFYIDNKYKYYDSIAPYQYSWNTAAYSDGNHTIKVTAYVSSIRKYITRTCAVTVDN